MRCPSADLQPAAELAEPVLVQAGRAARQVATRQALTHMLVP